MDIYIPYEKSYPNLEKALKEGARIHVFHSAASLRIVRVEDKNKNLVSYGEYPYLSGALSHAENNFGTTDYKELYSGKDAKYIHYISGSIPLPHDILDIYVFDGQGFDILYSKKQKVFICIRPIPEVKNNEKFIYGSSENLLNSIADCISTVLFSNSQIVENKTTFMLRHGIQF